MILCSLCFFVTVGLAELIPHLGLFISLVGSLSCSTLALVIPPIIDALCSWPEKSLLRYGRNGLICIFGIVGFLTGTYMSISEIVEAFKQKSG